MIWKLKGAVFSNTCKEWYQLRQGKKGYNNCLGCSLYWECYKGKIWSLAEQKFYVVREYCRQGYCFKTLELTEPFKKRRF